MKSLCDVKRDESFAFWSITSRNREKITGSDLARRSVERDKHRAKTFSPDQDILNICPDMTDCPLSFGYLPGKDLPAVEHTFPEFELDRDSCPPRFVNKCGNIG
jgi:hypothetical protein